MSVFQEAEQHALRVDIECAAPVDSASGALMSWLHVYSPYARFICVLKVNVGKYKSDKVFGYSPFNFYTLLVTSYLGWAPTAAEGNGETERAERKWE